ncbi:hypothetical protein ALC57_00500 [Trachymyrmex cornetzi]|uniref:Uncharacterized protein n=1 Tax=Trachymyrmex cornetzi TaxID=471704 RepID=A0A151JRS3_9HYME|nr:hypothetical protein ALC57_00500 [Trachymyrmex cornetzi]
MKREDRCERKGEQPRQPETSHRSVCGRSRLKILYTLVQSVIEYEIEVDYTPSTDFDKLADVPVRILPTDDFRKGKHLPKDAPLKAKGRKVLHRPRQVLKVVADNG